MTALVAWLEHAFGAIPLPLLEAWGRFSYFVGLALALLAFGGFTLGPVGPGGWVDSGRHGTARPFLSIPLTFVLVFVSGYLGSFIVLVPEAQTFESLKDL